MNEKIKAKKDAMQCNASWIGWISSECFVFFFVHACFNAYYPCKKCFKQLKQLKIINISF